MLALCITAVASSCTDGALNLNGILVSKGERPEIELCPGFIHYVATLEEGDGYAHPEVCTTQPRGRSRSQTFGTARSSGSSDRSSGSARQRRHRAPMRPRARRRRSRSKLTASNIFEVIQSWGLLCAL